MMRSLIAASPVLAHRSNHSIDAAPDGLASRHSNPRNVASVLIEKSRVAHSVFDQHYVEIQIDGARRVEHGFNVGLGADAAIFFLELSPDRALVFRVVVHD